MGQPLGSNGPILSGFPNRPERCLTCEWDSPELNDGVCPNCANPANYVNPPGWLSDPDSLYLQNSMVPASVTTDTNYSFASRQHTVFTPHAGNADSSTPSSSRDRSKRRSPIFFCDICSPPRKFSTTNDRDRHLRVRHEIIPAGHQGWMCRIPDCPSALKYWSRKDNFVQHVMRMHGKVLGNECEDWTVAFRPGEMVTTLAASESRRELTAVVSTNRSKIESQPSISTEPAPKIVRTPGITTATSRVGSSVNDRVMPPASNVSNHLPSPESYEAIFRTVSRSPYASEEAFAFQDASSNPADPQRFQSTAGRRGEYSFPPSFPDSPVLAFLPDPPKVQPQDRIEPVSPQPSPMSYCTYEKELHPDASADQAHVSEQPAQTQQDHPISGLEHVLSSLEERIGNTYGDVSTTSTLVQGNITIHLTKNITNNYVWDGRKSAFYDERDKGKRRRRANST